MNVTEAIRQRRSIRKFKHGAMIPQQDIDMMLEAAMMAPSAANSRPWEFVVVKNKDVFQEIMEVHPYTGMLADASLAIVVCGRPDLQTAPLLSGYWPQDCGAATENLLLQAAELGYGSVWCGAYPNQERVDGLRRVLDVTSVPVAVVAIGIPDEQPAARGFYDRERVKYI